MSEQFAGVVVNELRRLEAVIDAVGAQIQGKRTLTQPERASATADYSKLKEELRGLSATGTVGNARREQQDVEKRFFLPAVRQALQALRASTNTNPISSNWSSLLSEASREISYYLHRLEQEIK